MAKCDLRVVLDEPNRTYEPGDRVTGRVIADVDKTVRCDGLTVTHQWKTHGRGNVESGAAGAETVFRGEWSAGRYEYTFDFEQPPGPQTYHGHDLNVDWFVHVTADIPWALDPDAEADHLMRYDGPTTDYRVGNPETIESAGEQQEGSGGCLTMFGGVFVAAALITLVANWSGGDTSALFVGLVFLVVGGAITWAGVAKQLARSKLGDVVVELLPTHVRPGEEVRCVVTISPPKSTEVNHITYTLKAQEVVVRGSGTNKRTYTQDLHEDIKANRWDGPNKLEAGGENTFEQVFAIPEDAVASFDTGGDNKLEWSIQTEVDIPSWPDWSTKNVLIVVPGEAVIDSESGAEREAADNIDEGWW